ncbi:MAG TPA: SAM-dependent chlorinase/fluorinase [Bryobacteraceae bacterium]|jgi:S-adenosylmethionine hydrolase|nr:SAM-dependent chlorinase/fluorinase [Bryobacteraceae bacterium]
MAAKRIVTLSTDFGHKDHFVAVMKGVILSIAPDAEIVDVTHEVTPFEIVEAAFLISEAYQWFPRRTVHVVVVDPGVGTARRPILVEAAGHFFLGPDNGVLAMVYERQKHKAREITNERLFLKPLSRTFHGRDIFAPSAAHLVNGTRPATFGPLIDDHLKLALTKPQRTSKRAWTGTVLKVDRFGNLITNFHVDEFPAILTSPFDLYVGVRHIDQLALTFADILDVAAVIGSSGYIEIATNQRSAASLLGCGIGAPVELTLY